MAKPAKEVKLTAKAVSDEDDLKLEQLTSSIDKQFGKGTLMQMGKNNFHDVAFQDTGIMMLNQALSGKLNGGLPRGRIVEIYGPESGGKTTTTLKMIAKAQQEGGRCAFIDVEHAFDPAWAAKNGVDVESLWISQPSNAEEALEVMDLCIKSGLFTFLVLDSVAALVTKKELEGDMGDATVGINARLMSQAMRKLTASISKSKCVAVFINQVREKIGVMFGNPETTTGGRALKFAASIRMEVRKVETLKEGDVQVANRVKVKVVKNKVSPPFKEAEYEIRFDSGVDELQDLVEVAISKGVITKNGAWFNVLGKQAQGGAGVKKLLAGDDEIRNQVIGKIVNVQSEA